MTCINKLRNKCGSIILELAIAMPIFCITTLIILVAINCVRADIALTHAVDQVSGEVAYVLPVIDAGIELSEVALSLLPTDNHESSNTDNNVHSSSNIAVEALAFTTVLTDRFGISVTDIISTAVFGRAVRDRIDDVFYDISSSGVIYAHVDNIVVYLDFDRDNDVLWIYVHYDMVTPFGRYEKMLASAAPVYGDLSFDFLRGEQDEREDTIWQEDNFTRGRYLRVQFGANLPQNYPVIAQWNNGTATSIKSIDLTAPTYESFSAIERKVKSHIDDLSGFSGTSSPWGSDQIRITEDQISSRILLLVIPENSPAEAVGYLIDLQAYAQSQGVTLQIERHENSYRYEQSDQENE